VCLQEPPRERKRFEIRHTAYEISQRKRVWTAAGKGSGLALDSRRDLSKGGNDNVIVTDVRRRGEKVTRIVDMYDQKDTQSRERPARKLGWQRIIWQGCTMLAGDFNAHSKRWDPRCTEPRDDVFWEDIIEENGLEIGNDDRATHYWKTGDLEAKSVIGLTLVNQPIGKWTILAENHATGSDHEVIEWEVDVDTQEEADHERVVGWNLAAMTEEDKEAAKKLWMASAKESAHLDAACTEDNVEQEAT